MHILNKSKMAWRIEVTFEGKQLPKKYITPDIRNTDPGWGSELFKRKIERLEFHLPTGNRILLEGMERYNFFLEAVKNIGGGSCDKAQIKAFYFCGKIPGIDAVDVWRIDIKKQRIQLARKSENKVWNNKPARGWKQGLSGKPVSKIV